MLAKYVMRYRSKQIKLFFACIVFLATTAFNLSPFFWMSYQAYAQDQQALQKAVNTLKIQDKVDRLLILMRQRLSVMHAVAQWKWNHRLPVEDIGRERQLLASLVNKGRSYGLDPAFIKFFFRAQIDAAKIIQRADYYRWTSEQIGTFSHAPDLKLVLRPQLDKISANLLVALADIFPLLDQLEVRQMIQIRARDILKGEGIDDRIRTILVGSLTFEPVSSQ